MAKRLLILSVVALLFLNIGLYIGKRDNSSPMTVDIKTPYIAAGNGMKQQTVQEEPKMINLNTATKEELMRINNIGEVLAQRIIDKRDELGGSFKSVEDVKTVHGIGNKKYQVIEESVYIEQ